MNNPHYKYVVLAVAFAAIATTSITQAADVTISSPVFGPQTIDLTTDVPTGYTELNWTTYYTTGTTDPTNSKLGGTLALTVTAVGTDSATSAPPSPSEFNGNALTFKWEDGNPTLVNTGENNGIFQDTHGATDSAAGNGYSITTGILALGFTYELHLYTGVYQGVDTVSASLSGGEVVSNSASAGNQTAEYTIDFTPTQAGQTLTVNTIETAAANANVPLDAISLSAEAVPEPSTYGLLGLGALVIGFQLRRKNRLNS